jgi:SAM-dependent methyltransferase
MTSHASLKVPAPLIAALRCPGFPQVPLRRDGDSLVCTVDGKTLAFPVLHGTPVLIDEGRSVFKFADFESGGVTTMDIRDEAVRLGSPLARFKHWVMSTIPDKSRSVSDFPAERALAEILRANPEASILVVGAGDARFEAGGGAHLVYSDVALAPDTQLIADAHDLPFADATFDAVFAVAVLEHVADPYRCVAEFKRVLKPNGYVYAATPFLQQVHMGAYDFTRFTALGHRRLFRWFDELKSGVANGPGMVVSWGIEYFLTSFSETGSRRSALLILSRFVAWPFLLLDRFLAKKAGAYDCASAYYFFGRLREMPVSDRDIVAAYKGLVGRK